MVSYKKYCIRNSLFLFFYFKLLIFMFTVMKKSEILKHLYLAVQKIKTGRYAGLCIAILVPYCTYNSKGELTWNESGKLKERFLRSLLQNYKPKTQYEDGAYWFPEYQKQPRLKVLYRMIADIKANKYLYK